MSQADLEDVNPEIQARPDDQDAQPVGRSNQRLALQNQRHGDDDRPVAESDNDEVQESDPDNQYPMESQPNSARQQPNRRRSSKVSFYEEVAELLHVPKQKLLKFKQLNDDEENKRRQTTVRRKTISQGKVEGKNIPVHDDKIVKKGREDYDSSDLEELEENCATNLADKTIRLSYAKMRQERNIRQVRRPLIEEKRGSDGQIEQRTKYVKFKSCKTSTGWFMPFCGKRLPKSDLGEELGVGICIYFKQLKYMACMFLLFTILSIPSFLLFYQGNESTNGNIYDSKSFFSTFTLGNLGQSARVCETIPQGSQETVIGYCPFGLMSDIQLYAMARPSDEFTCSDTTELIEELENDDCNQVELFRTKFNQNCKGTKNCTLTLENGFSSNCKQAGYELHAVFYCRAATIRLPYKIPFYGNTITRQTITATVMVADFIIVCAFIVMSLYLNRAITQEAVDMDLDAIQTTDFAVKIKNLPEAKKFDSIEQFKAMLALKLQTVIGSQYVLNNLFALKGNENNTKIAQIALAKKNFKSYSVLMEVHKLCNQGQKIRIRQQKIKPESKRYEKFEKEMDKIKEKLKEYAQDYKKEQDDANEIKCAFVTFKSMEGQMRCIKAYEPNRCGRCCLWARCRQKEYIDNYFLGKWLQVEKACEPSVILWENMGYNKKQRRCRQAFSVLVAILLIIFTLCFVVYAKNADDDIQAFSPQIDCDEDQVITPSEALTDYKKPHDEQAGLMYCFCKNNFDTELEKGNSQAAFLPVSQFEDEVNYCASWLTMYISSQGLVLIVPLAITMVTTTSSFILRLMAKFEKHHSRPDEIYSSAINMFLLSFINNSILILLVNFNLGKNFRHLPILSGSYDEFSVEWYRLVGSTICVTMMMMVVSPFASNSAFQLMYAMKRCCDRGCHYSSRYTKQLTQADYQDLNTGGEFMMEFRYANLLNVMMCTMLFGAGIPILYFIAFLFFVVTYWADCLLLFNCYRKPVNFDHMMALKSMKMYKYAIVAHLICGMFMFSNSSILPYYSANSAISATSIVNKIMPRFMQENPYFIGLQLTSRGILYIMFFLLLAFVYLVYQVLFSRFAHKCAQGRAWQKLLEQTNVEGNFYSCVNFRTLRMENAELEYELDKIFVNIQQGPKGTHEERCCNTCCCYKPKDDIFGPKQKERYYAHLIEKRDAIQHEMREVAKREIEPDKTKGETKETIDREIDTKPIEQVVKMMHKYQSRTRYLDESKIKDELQSYNMLHNDRYANLDEVKKLFDQQAHNQNIELSKFKQFRAKMGLD